MNALRGCRALDLAVPQLEFLFRVRSGFPAPDFCNEKPIEVVALRVWCIIPVLCTRVVVVLALAVVGQHLDHTAVTHPTAPALIHHSLKFGPESRQLRDASIDLGQMVARDAVRLVTGGLWFGRHVQKSADIVYFKP